MKPVYPALPRTSRTGLLLLMVVLAFPARGYVLPPVERYRPSILDLMESSLYWMQDLSGADNPRDPATLVALMEDQAARFFDFSAIAWQVGGPRYARMNLLQRSHFQNRIRDMLFEGIARRMGLFGNRIPRFQPIPPVQTGPDTIAAGGVFFHPGGPDYRLVFHFHLTPTGWRIYDVQSNGSSAVAALRRSLPRW